MHSVHKIILGSLVGITMFSGVILANTTTSATEEDTIIDEVNVTVPVSCSMEGTGMNSHETELFNNEYDSNVGTTNIKAYCNDVNGFAIYAIGYTDDIDGKNVLTDSNLSSTNDITTGVATTGSDSKWAMKLATVTSPAPTYPITIQSDQEGPFTSFHTVPDDYTLVAKRTSATDAGSSAIGSTFTTTYQIYIGPTQSAGTYNGQVKYVLVHPQNEIPLSPQTATSGCINYFPNGSNVVGTMGCQSISASDTTATLLASNFSRANYGFAGWSDSYDYATNPNAKFYGPQETITFTAGQYTSPNNGLSLYAVWVSSAGTIQSWNGCSNLTTAPTDGTANLASVTALTDQRDNETYAVARLADGKCWMIENLRLESTAAHNSDGTLAQGYGTSATYGNFSGLASPEAPWAYDSTTANSLYSRDGADNTIKIAAANAGYRFPRYNSYNNQSTSANRPQDPTTNDAANSTTDSGMYSYGNYYTWHAAIADTTHYAFGDHNTTSICPFGWQIPLGDTSTGNISQGASDVANKVGGFSYLDRKMGGTGTSQSTTAASLRWRKFPVNFLYAGYVSGSLLHYRGISGSYWSSTAKSNSDGLDSYLLYLSSNPRIQPGTIDVYKSNGFSIRCVASS